MHGLPRRAAFRVVTKPALALLRFLSGLGVLRKPPKDSYDCTGFLRHCTSLKALEQIHAQIISGGCSGNPYLAANLVTQYVELGAAAAVRDARHVFDFAVHRDVVMWNVMVRGYGVMGLPDEALGIYCRMRRGGVPPNRYTYPFVLKACAAIGDVRIGRIVHGDALKNGLEMDIFGANALVACYGKCGDVATARQLFDEIPFKDSVSWNSIIGAYGLSEHAPDALILLRQMLKDDAVSRPDYVTLVGLLPVCAKLAAVKEGLWIHSYVIKSGMEVDSVLGSGLVAMYANCGRLPVARVIFDRISVKNVVAWNAMIRGYGMHGHASEALCLFSEMLSVEIQPDGICFASVLSACSHAGMVEKGWEFFHLMEEYHVEKGEIHYSCMADLLGRAGCLREAMEFISSLPIKPGKDIWGALLGACRIHNNVELAEEVAERLFVLDPGNAGRYLALAKMYEDAGRWKDAARLRTVMRERNVTKPLGCSSIEVDSMIHIFGVEDESHPMSEEIHDALEGLGRMVEEEHVVAAS